MRKEPVNYKKYTSVIGIDPGVETGVAVFDTIQRRVSIIDSMKIHEAMDVVKGWKEYGPIFVRVEDARQRKWFGNSGREQLQGAGSIKRDCKIWEDFLKNLGVDFEMVPPKSNKTKLDAAKFKMVSKYEGRTNEHSRDAAMLVIGL